MTQRADLPKRSLRAKCHTVSRLKRKCHKESTAFTGPTLIKTHKLWIVLRAEIFYTEFHPNRTINVETTDSDQFIPLSTAHHPTPIFLTRNKSIMDFWVQFMYWILSDFRRTDFHGTLVANRTKWLSPTQNFAHVGRWRCKVQLEDYHIPHVKYRSASTDCHETCVLDNCS